MVLEYNYVFDYVDRISFLRMVEFEVSEHGLPKIPYGMWKKFKQLPEKENLKMDVEHVFTSPDEIKVRLSSTLVFTLDVEWLECFEKFNRSIPKPFKPLEAKCEAINKLANSLNNEREENNMFNFDFGVYNASNVRFSPYGLAIYNKGAGRYVAYNKEAKDIIDVDIINFSADKMMYKIPVAISKVAAGDVILHTGVPMIVTKIYDSKLKAIDPSTAEEKTILPIKSPFKFDFVTKIISIVDFTNTNASVDSPFGNMLPFLMMGDNKELDPMLMAMMMSGGNMDFDMSNPFMWLMFSGKSGDTASLLPMIMMMNQNKEVKESK